MVTRLADSTLNAALIDYASEFVHPVLTNCQLPAYTIGTSWIKDSAYDRDIITELKVDEGGQPVLDKNGNEQYNYYIKPTNVATYKYTADGPAITWTVDGKPATEINVASPKTVTITVTATKNGITASKTFTRKVAPVAIRDLALGTGDCLNGAWIEGAPGTEKLIAAKYLGEKLVNAEVIDFAVEKDKGSIYDAATSCVRDLAGYTHPKETATYDQIKLFIVAADGITPIAYANAELHD